MAKFLTKTFNWLLEVKFILQKDSTLDKTNHSFNKLIVVSMISAGKELKAMPTFALCIKKCIKIKAFNCLQAFFIKLDTAGRTLSNGLDKQQNMMTKTKFSLKTF